MAQHDPLTGLANRILFRDRLVQALARSKRTGQLVGIMLLDLDRFKAVNDRLGHECGDQLLKGAAERLQSCVREADTVCRLGGDEFSVLLEGVSSERDLLMVVNRLLGAIGRAFTLGGDEASVGVSIGITVFPWDDQGAEELLKHADLAMYRAKGRGGQTYQFYVRSKPRQAVKTLHRKRS